MAAAAAADPRAASEALHRAMRKVVFDSGGEEDGGLLNYIWWGAERIRPLSPERDWDWRLDVLQKEGWVRLFRNRLGIWTVSYVRPGLHDRGTISPLASDPPCSVFV